MKQDEFIKELLTTYELKGDYPKFRYDLLNYISKKPSVSEEEIKIKADEFIEKYYSLAQLIINSNTGVRIPLNLSSILTKFALSLPPDAENWISVDERLPDYYSSVLAVSEGEAKAVVHRVSDGDNQYYIITGSDETFKKVTHWMQLPKPPINKQGGK